MKYAVLKVINGNYFVRAEGFTDLEKAKVNYFELCQTLHNATDVNTACISIADENLDCVQGYKEFVDHRPAPEPAEVAEVEA